MVKKATEQNGRGVTIASGDERVYLFPELGVSVKAKSLSEAETKAIKKVKEKK